MVDNQESLSEIQDYAREIACMTRIIETWPEDKILRQRCEFFIRTAQYEIENITEGVENGREEKVIAI